MKTTTQSLLALTLAAFACFATTAHATVIFTEGFEASNPTTHHPNASYTGLYQDNPAGWSGGITLITTEPGTQYFSTPFGTKAAGNYNNGPSITLTDVLLANTTYTLTLNVGTYKNNFYNSLYQVDFLAGATVVATTGQTAVTTSDLSEVATLTFTTGASHAELGNALTIRLGANGVRMGVYDNISLDASAVPEPSAALLGGLGMLALLRRRR